MKKKSKAAKAVKIALVAVSLLLVLAVIFVVAVANLSRGLGNYGSYTANKQALAKDPNNPTALRGVGEYERTSRNYEKALEHFQAALRLEPDNNQNQYNVAYTLGRMGRSRESLEAMKKAAQGGGIAAGTAQMFLEKMQKNPDALADKKWVAGDKTIFPIPEQVRPNSDMKKDQ